MRVAENRDFTLVDVSFPFVRPEVRSCIERLPPPYRRASHERLVVTSLTWPNSRQPSYASDRSVHPTGMAVDLRRPGGRRRAWLESVLLYLEASGVIETTYERPRAALSRGGVSESVRGVHEAVNRPCNAPDWDIPAADTTAFHVVRRGDTLTRIARRHRCIDRYPPARQRPHVVSHFFAAGAQSAPERNPRLSQSSPHPTTRRMPVPWWPTRFAVDVAESDRPFHACAVDRPAEL